MFGAPPLESSRPLAMQLRFWQKDRFMEVAFAQVQGSTEVPEVPLSSLTLRQLIEEYSRRCRQTMGELSFQQNLASWVDDLCSTVLEERWLFAVMPHTGRTRFEFRLGLMRYYSISNTIKKIDWRANAHAS